MKRYLSLSIVFWLFTTGLMAQTAEEDFYDAIYFYEEEEDFEEALFLFKKVLRDEPDNANVKYWIGMCCNNIRGEEYKGIPYFMEATKSISLKYKKNRYNSMRLQ